jgi:putative drug exporter of the RND superfamily
MARLARWCFAHRRTVVAVWILALVAVAGISAAAGSSFNTNLSLPDTDSGAAASLLATSFPAASGEGDQVVIQATHGSTIRSAPVRAAVTAALARVSAVPGVESVASPYGRAGAAQISRSGTIAFARVTWDRQTAQITAADARSVIAAAETAGRQNVRVSLSGPSITNSERTGLGKSVGVGVVAALVILLIVFGGALLAALMPLATAILALGVGVSLIGLLSHAFDVSSVSTQLAVLIGLGVGVDYGLFIISRHRSAVKSGLSYADAAAEAASTSGRTVLLAGLTVCIALLGQFALGVSFLYGVSVAAAITVALTMATSLTFLPAMLGFLGPRILSRRERAALAADGPAHADGTGPWLRWARFVEARKALVALAALAVVVVLALPAFGLRLGSADASTDPPSWTTHQADTALARGFGPGFNGPLELAAQVRSPAGVTAFDQLLATAARTSGVASVTPAATSPNGKVMIATLYPASSPQARQTADLVNHLRQDLVPAAEQDHGLVIHVGGVTAANIDFARVLTDKLPVFIAVVVLLAFLLLLVVFRSLLVPLVASIMNLLSVGAALGAVNAVFNWGWGASALGLSGTGPVEAFLPVIMFSVLFGLSMDYEVFTVSRMQEEWRGGPVEIGGAAGSRVTARNHLAVTVGQAKSSRIIAAAAGIMIVVFGSFLLSDHRILEEFGFGLGFSVLVDALVIRSLLLPALMHLIGPANWSLPRWLDHALPRLSIDAPAGQQALPAGAGLSPPAGFGRGSGSRRRAR